MNNNIQLLLPANTNVNHSDMKLGKKPPIKDKRTLKLSNYLIKYNAPKLPDTYILNTDIKKWGVMKNDVIGDCTIAAAGHLIMGWSNDVGVVVNSESDNPTTNKNGDLTTEIDNIEKKVENFIKKPYVLYGLAGLGGLILITTLLSIFKSKK